MPGRDRAIAVAEDSARTFKTVADRIVSRSAPVDVIKETFERLKLLDGIQFVNQRVTQLITWELEGRIRDGELPADLSDDLIAGGIALSEQLERSGINIERDADAIVSDIRNAQYISRQNMALTVDTFSETAAELVEQIKRSAKEAGETSPSDPANRRLAQLCILLLTTTQEWPDDVDIDMCRGTKLQSIYRESGHELKFDTILAKIQAGQLPAQRDRVCLYSQYLRAARLFKVRRPLKDRPAMRMGTELLSPVVNRAREEYDRIPVTEEEFDSFLFASGT